MDLTILITRAVGEHRRDIAIMSGNDSRNYAELDRRARRLANGLGATGLRPGDRVGVLAENSILYPEVDIALAYAGLVRVALNARLGLPEFSYILDDAGVRALVTDDQFDETAAVLAQSFDLVWLRQGASVPTGATDLEHVIDKGSETRPDAVHHAEDPAWISYTSGTTGKPKGVVLSRRALVQVTFNLLMELGPPVPGRSVLLPQQFSHGAGFFLWPYLATGGTVHIQRKWDPEEALDIGRRHRIDTLKLVPAMLFDLIQTSGSATFETIIYGAAPLPAAHLEAATDRFGEAFIQIYGQSEAPATLAVLHKSDHARPGPHRHSAGRPWRTVDLVVLDPAGHPVEPGEMGEIVARGTQFMTGYHRLPKETTETLRDGWLWTRDMGVMDEDGFVYLRGRRDDTINSGGFNIAPKEVEEIVEAHPAVDECVAVGVPDRRLGQMVRVYITLAGAVSFDEEDLIEFCKPRLGFRRRGQW